jgi:F0F1-type ATP synthase assembly protein I
MARDTTDLNFVHPMDPNPSRKNFGTLAKQIAIATQLPLTLVGPMFVGGALGYLLDRWLHTKFALMIILGVIGFAIGLREVLRFANAEDKKTDGQ